MGGKGDTEMGDRGWVGRGILTWGTGVGWEGGY